MPGSRQSGRNALHELDVLRDVLPHDPVAARGSARQPAVLVAEVDGETVDLEFAEVVDRTARVPLHPSRPGQKLVDTKDVVEAEHALRMLHGIKQARGTATHRLCGAVLPLQLGERPLEFLKPTHHRVVVGVADEFLVALVVGVAQFEDARC